MLETALSLSIQFSMTIEVTNNFLAILTKSNISSFRLAYLDQH
jgi:hypothetical protein